MPLSTPYHSFRLPYPIQVDSFADMPGALRAALHLLTHTHADHVGGLQARSFGQALGCSADTKVMLLRHEALRARAAHDDDARVARRRRRGYAMKERSIWEQKRDDETQIHSRELRDDVGIQSRACPAYRELRTPRASRRATLRNACE
jgi:glyoxylase-like metal-dependent hydrolase (beta-lactamase superfamily II)